MAAARAAVRVGGRGVSARAIVLAAGKGTRMKSARPKVLHELCGRSMLWWVLEALREAGIDDVVVVANPELETLLLALGVRTVVQHEQLGTGHAVRIALDALPPQDGTLVVAYGDMPLVEPGIFREVQGALDGEAALALVTARMPLPSSFGRVVRTAEGVERIVEAKDCTPAQLAIEEMNAGIYAYDERALRETIVRVGNGNAQGEYYLTDTVELLLAAGRRVRPVLAADHRSVLGVNDRVELANAAAIMNRRLCEEHMRAGVTIVDPATTYLEPGLMIGADTVILPGTTIGGTTTIGAGSRIGPRSRLADATLGEHVQINESVVVDSRLGDRCKIGPYAHLRGGCVFADDVTIGDYVECKNATLAARVKAMHLTYLGDCSVGPDTNIGAGTITCNYDGVNKNRTEIAANVFIGTNTLLVAPVTVGEGAMTGAGTVVIRDVPPHDRVVGNPARSIAKKPAET
ncbi:MAG TPA: bifunctional UDP-N-acetylglucosamine diphosphorylase/glucosamine-1-phosphate N-acetyltransferase GlmU [Candidatus Limnocylindria bacterium]|jgi:bifunctional UDP-N-acetylglucosamine pyrophosphorylase/glucosamine-1-phosphate N-acetyltransferase|nr:bifunctional UDP-N-acetylglucosamine diphosphorylase/glucosamine-1-phosphate N-acetyltransferase GlmU [Candidatus Limnocylindria bacterium]